MRYGFIGLGHLGRHLAANLVRGGFDVGVYDLDRRAADGVVAAGGHWVASVPALAQACDCLITCLPSPAATAAVLGEALPAMRAGSTWIEMSTNDFAEVEALAARAQELGHRHPRLPGHRRRASRRSGRHHRVSWRRATSVRGSPTGARSHGRPRHSFGRHRAGGRHQGRHQHAGLHPFDCGRRGLDAVCKSRRRSARGVSRRSPPAPATASCTRPRVRSFSTAAMILDLRWI